MLAIGSNVNGYGLGLIAWVVTTGVAAACAGFAGWRLAISRSGAAATLANLRSALDRASSTLATFDAEDRLTFWTDGYAELLQTFGLTAQSGMAFRATLATASSPGLPTEIARAVLLVGHGGTKSTLDDFPTPDGRWIRAGLNAADGGGFVMVLTDVTEHLAIMRREAQARRRADAAIEARSVFLANMNHEIRTPLNGVIGMVQIMQRDTTEPVQQSRLGVIGDAGQALLTALNNVLDLSRIETGKFGLDLQGFDLDDTARQVATAHAPEAARKGVELRLEIDPQALGAWRGDAPKLRQVLSNLVSNAIKFTAEGCVIVRVANCSEGLTFTVADTGIGVSESQHEAIFDSFFQVDASTTRRFGGAGLGLTICRHLVRLMGGELKVASREGEGAAFSFTLPIERSAAPVCKPAPQALPMADCARPLRVLIAEDNPMNLLVLESMLEPLDVVVTSVVDGRAAVTAFVSDPFDLVLMDIHMPVMDGVDAAVMIRESERLTGRRRTPILALTANVMPQQLESYENAGMDGVITKPVMDADLTKALAQARASAQAAECEHAARSAA